MPIKLNSSGGGSVTIDVPSTASAYTLTAPAANATLITTGSSGQNIPKAALPTGSVLQVVTATLDNVSTVTSSGSFVTTSWSGTITPTSATSKVLVIVSGGSIYCGTTAGVAYYGTIYRNNSTNLGNGTWGLERFTTPGGNHSLAPHSMMVLDSPATTSATTYTPYFRNGGTVGQVDFNNTDRGVTTMILMEIAA